MKNKLSTARGKVLAGAIAVTLVTGAGFAAANSDAGGALQAWYNKAFGIATMEMAVDTGKHGAEKTLEFTTHAATETKAGVTAINTKKGEEQTAKTDNIRSAKDSHINAVNGKQVEIAGYMAAQFDELSRKSINAFNFTSDVAYGTAEFGMGFTANLTGRSALKSLEQELNAEKRKAVTELETAIANAKGTLLTQLESEKDMTTEEIKAAIDEKIGQLKNKITEKKAKLVEEHEGKLLAAAEKIESDAKSDMDALVAGINN